MVALMALVTHLVVYCSAFNILPTVMLDLFVRSVTEDVLNAPLWLVDCPKASLDDEIFLFHQCKHMDTVRCETIETNLFIQILIRKICITCTKAQKFRSHYLNQGQPH